MSVPRQEISWEYANGVTDNDLQMEFRELSSNSKWFDLGANTFGKIMNLPDPSYGLIIVLKRHFMG